MKDIIILSDDKDELYDIHLKANEIFSFNALCSPSYDSGDVSYFYVLGIRDEHLDRLDNFRAYVNKKTSANVYEVMTGHEL